MSLQVVISITRAHWAVDQDIMGHGASSRPGTQDSRLLAANEDVPRTRIGASGHRAWVTSTVIASRSTTYSARSTHILSVFAGVGKYGARVVVPGQQALLRRILGGLAFSPDSRIMVRMTRTQWSVPRQQEPPMAPPWIRPTSGYQWYRVCMTRAQWRYTSILSSSHIGTSVLLTPSLFDICRLSPRFSTNLNDVHSPGSRLQVRVLRPLEMAQGFTGELREGLITPTNSFPGGMTGFVSSSRHLRFKFVLISSAFTASSSVLFSRPRPLSDSISQVYPCLPSAFAADVYSSRADFVFRVQNHCVAPNWLVTAWWGLLC